MLFSLSVLPSFFGFKLNLHSLVSPIALWPPLLLFFSCRSSAADCCPSYLCSRLGMFFLLMMCFLSRPLCCFLGCPTICFSSIWQFVVPLGVWFGRRERCAVIGCGLAGEVVLCPLKALVEQNLSFWVAQRTCMAQCIIGRPLSDPCMTLKMPSSHVYVCAELSPL